MISVLSQAPAPAPIPEAQRPSVDLHELFTIQEAIEPFVSLHRRSGEAVRLHCVIPTSCTSEACTDLHDLNDLRVRSLLYVHKIVEGIRASEVPASYRLCSSTSDALSTCLVCAVPLGHDPSTIKTSACEAMRNTKFRVREKAFVAHLPLGPALVIT